MARRIQPAASRQLVVIQARVLAAAIAASLLIALGLARGAVALVLHVMTLGSRR